MVNNVIVMPLKCVWGPKVSHQQYLLFQGIKGLQIIKKFQCNCFDDFL